MKISAGSWRMLSQQEKLFILNAISKRRSAWRSPDIFPMEKRPHTNFPLISSHTIDPSFTSLKAGDFFLLFINQTID